MANGASLHTRVRFGRVLACLGTLQEMHDCGSKRVGIVHGNGSTGDGGVGVLVRGLRQTGGQTGGVRDNYGLLAGEGFEERSEASTKGVVAQRDDDHVGSAVQRGVAARSGGLVGRTNWLGAGAGEYGGEGARLEKGAELDMHGEAACGGGECLVVVLFEAGGENHRENASVLRLIVERRGEECCVGLFGDEMNPCRGNAQGILEEEGLGQGVGEPCAYDASAAEEAECKSSAGVRQIVGEEDDSRRLILARPALPGECRCLRRWQK